MTLRQLSGTALLCLTLLCACSSRSTTRIEGDTPGEVAQSIYLIRDSLPPEMRKKFTSSLSLLKMTTTDRYSVSQVMFVTPQFAQMIRGRTPYEVIQMASVYRNSIPQYTTLDAEREDQVEAERQELRNSIRLDANVVDSQARNAM